MFADSPLSSDPMTVEIFSVACAEDVFNRGAILPFESGTNK